MPIRMAHFGSFFGPVFTEDAVLSDILLMSFSLLRCHLFDKGILLRGEGGGFLSTAHTNEDIDCIIQAMKDSIAELQEAGFSSILLLKEIMQVREASCISPLY